MANKTHLEFTDPWSLHEDRQAGIFAWVILGLMFGFFIGIVVRDMVKKSRTRELQDEWSTFTKLLNHLVNLPCILCTKDNYMPVWYSFTNIFRSSENQRYWKTKEEEEKEVARGPFDSRAAIARLGGGWPPKKSSSDLESGSQDTEIELLYLPKVTDLPAAGTGLPKIEKLSVVFEVPEILPSNTDQKDDGFQPDSIHGSGSGPDSLSKLTATFNFQPTKDRNKSPTVAEKGKERLTEGQKDMDETGKKGTDREDETSPKDHGDSSTRKSGESCRQT
ncbi:hypothetical protein FPOA_10475 [Fusarium poae]|uniref:Uncharacterized protein n=1 Tax=Fusarium poae TaxID=36050 RepID=A0A1B8AE37_FUSPO|nr:hypothetical protein FPOA_10475 [Fusarium poae]